ncbi:UDP-3-O-acyl-N-acetylglucosamine deacetylase [Synechococcus sp. CCY9201]|uniref:UDP-3-O-acyl-N-acetylglucosamine deacetylase n=1 Tax=Synechococcus sp. CCY9201 TaxID=174697 RepID=UPI002B220D9E|nr:UDP-3-O-acyl-N-acetylglucosamine deacetylase [Synechococcus sp. CCY9201]MEA5474772.1 UDP-3-O-acyl-N-acetylglucosamine deacetylase [Synechococcus sp. CCY9201]
MGIWPSDYDHGWTLASSIERSGVGLHSGAEGRVRLRPSEQPGYRVGWLQHPARPSLALHPSQVCETQLCTALRLNSERLATVEHLLAALAGTGITQAEILVDGEEIPVLDGSAMPWVEAIAEAGLAPVAVPTWAPAPREPITLQQGSGFAVALPAERLHVGAAIEFPQAAIGRQVFSVALTPEVFVREVAPARTFGFRDQVNQLRAAGLIRGGDLDNALVCDGDTWLNPPLRFVDEPVRHKLLDLLGDLALAGLPRAQVFAYRGSHGLHTALAAALARAVSVAA